jgi:serine/threonine-protein kinase
VGAAVLAGLVWAGMSSKPAPVPVPVAEPASAPVAIAATEAASEPASAPPAATEAASAAAAAVAATSEPAASAVAEESAPIPTVVLKRPVNAAAKPAPKETLKERRAREAREARAASVPAPAAPVVRGVVRIAISPWGDVEVDGKLAGTSPPLTELSLPEGRHQIVIRNTDLPPHNVVINVTADQPVTLKHKF